MVVQTTPIETLTRGKYFPPSASEKGPIPINTEGKLRLGHEIPVFLFIDLFAGAGGVTTGLYKARHQGRAFNKVIAAVNHDPFALQSHKSNHVKVVHFNEGVQDVDLSKLLARVREYREKYPNAILIVWGSPDCTGHSIANGGRSKKKDTRTQPNFLIRYVKILQPDYVMVENVKEIRAWGPRDKHDKLIPKTKGKYYHRWVNRMSRQGSTYQFKYRLMNSADYGEPQNRVRWFGMFARKGLPIVFPSPTHADGSTKDLAGTGLKPWVTVKTVLELENTGKSIFDRKKYLCDKTLKRILAGLHKHVAPHLEKGQLVEEKVSATMVQWLHKTGNSKGKVFSINRPFRVVSGEWSETLVSASFAPFLDTFHGSAKAEYVRPGSSLKKPCPTVTSFQRISMVSPIPVASGRPYLIKYYSNGKNTVGTDAPAPTVTGKDRFALIQAIPAFLDKQYGSGLLNHQPLTRPAGTLTQNPKLELVSPKGFLLNPQFESKGGSLERPCFTLIARMDKAPPYLMKIQEDRPLAIIIYEDDPEPMKEIKRFMATYGLSDIHKRMLTIPELKRIQGFPDDYELQGSESAQKKQIGNAVTPKVPQRWSECVYEVILKRQQLGLTNNRAGA